MVGGSGLEVYHILRISPITYTFMSLSVAISTVNHISYGLLVSVDPMRGPQKPLVRYQGRSIF